MEQLESVRSEVSDGHMDAGISGTSTRRKRRKREHRPESIIVYRSDPERAAGEEQGADSEAGERNSEEGATFLNNPSSEGEACYPIFPGKKKKGFGHISHILKCRNVFPLLNKISKGSLKINKHIVQNEDTKYHDTLRL